jgi:replicative DNA helicase
MSTVQPLDQTRRRSTGRVPPHNLQAEESLLGAVLLSKDALAAVAETGLVVDEFYKPAHAHIYSSILSLDSRGEPADPITVADALARDGLLEATGGIPALMALQADTPATSNAGRYARIVRDMAQLRSLIGAAGDIAEMSYALPDDVPATLDRAETLMFAIGQGNLTDSMVTLDAVLDEGLASIEAHYERGEALTGLPTGFVDLDEMLCGLQGGDLIVVGARPSVGKSAFALDMARHVVAEKCRPVLLFSLEMSREQLAHRVFAAESRVDLARVRSGRLLDSDWPKLRMAAQRLAGAPLLIDVNRDLTINEIRAKARRARSSYGDLGMVIIDYVQLMRSDAAKAENRQLEVARISRGCKVLAGELGVPIVALSSLSRNVELRADKRPVLADLRESGALEADADVVVLLYRDELYDVESRERGTAEVIVAKQRNGPTGTVRLAFLGPTAKFANMARI